MPGTLHILTHLTLKKPKHLEVNIIIIIPNLQVKILGDFPGGTVVKNLPASAGDTSSIPGLGGSHMLQSN